MGKALRPLQTRQNGKARLKIIVRVLTTLKFENVESKRLLEYEQQGVCARPKNNPYPPGMGGGG